MAKFLRNGREVPKRNSNGRPMSSTIPGPTRTDITKPVGRRARGYNGVTLLQRIRDLLRERSLNENSRYDSRFDEIANAYVRAMEAGSFVHLKEFIDREMGKVPTRVADADGKNLKMYAALPIKDDDPEAP
jgi:hypothetical protein